MNKKKNERKSTAETSSTGRPHIRRQRSGTHLGKRQRCCYLLYMRVLCCCAVAGCGTSSMITSTAFTWSTTPMVYTLYGVYKRLVPSISLSPWVPAYVCICAPSIVALRQYVLASFLRINRQGGYFHTGDFILSLTRVFYISVHPASGDICIVFCVRQ